MNDVKQQKRKVSVGEPEGGDVYFILHIPKCAGRTVQHFIVSKFGDKSIASDERDKSECFLGNNIFYPSRRKAPYRYFGKFYDDSDLVSPDPIDFVLGHYITNSLKDRFPNRNIKETVLVRDPVGHFFSHYNFRMQKYTNSGLNAFGFKLWYKSRRPNPISKYILQYLEVPFFRQLFLSDQHKLDLILDALSEFLFVGVHTDCGKLIAQIAEEKGVIADFETRNVTYKKFIDYYSYEKEFSETIIDENRIDQAIYEYCSSFEPIETRRRPKIRGREFRNFMKGTLVPLYILRYRIKRQLNI